jgi:hypothetical protein
VAAHVSPCCGTVHDSLATTDATASSAAPTVIPTAFVATGSVRGNRFATIVDAPTTSGATSAARR